jgi:hypothetical protein
MHNQSKRQEKEEEDQLTAFKITRSDKRAM